MLEKAAKEISDFLMTGMHHSTKEGQQAIQAIIKKHFSRAIACEERINWLVRSPNPNLNRIREEWVARHIILENAFDTLIKQDSQ